MSQTKQAWDRLTNETAEEYLLFIHFRDLPTLERTKQRVSEDLNVKLSTCTRLHKKYSWAERSAKFEDLKIGLDTDSIIAARGRARKRHLVLSNMMLEKASDKLKTLSNKDISVTNMTKIIDSAMKIQLLSLGMSTENVGEVDASTKNDFKFSNLSDKELELMESLQKKGSESVE